MAGSEFWDNPMGTDGFEFIEYAAPDPAAMAAVFERMGWGGGAIAIGSESDNATGARPDRGASMT